MKNLITRSVLLLTFLIAVFSWAQDMPLVYDVENTGADCPTPYLPTMSELPTVQNLPDPFEWSDGRGRVAHFEDWRYRRAEIKAEIEHYEIGEKPARPDSITATYANDTLKVNITVNGNTLTLTSVIVLPSGNGPFPAIIGLGGGTGSVPSYIFTGRDIAIVPFYYWEVMAHQQTRGKEPINKLYPDLAYIGAYSAWPWGVSRLIDGLELVQDVLPIDLKHLAVTGCSFAGKMALFSGALDERIALTISQESGGGGYTTWRFSQTLSGVENLGSTDHTWFIDDMFDYSNAVTKLPHDHHELIAMVAPRALLVTGNPDYVWLADESGYVGSKAAQEVYKALGIPDRFGYSIIGGHMHCAIPNSQIPEIESFVDKFLLGIETANTDVATSPYQTDLSPWITWDTPTLSHGSSFFEKPSLTYPTNAETGLDTSLTLTWGKLDNAVQYVIELSADQSFSNIVVCDSTVDTTYTVSELSWGTRYYWRIKAHDASNSWGPSSDRYYFSTFIELPDPPQPVSTTLYRENKPEYMLMTWKKAKNAVSYYVQLSRAEDFSTFAMTATATDTFKAFSGSREGQKYYWRVQARNVSGSSLWSDVESFMVMLPPTELTLQKNSSTEMALTWKANSQVAEGYIIERKQESQTAFAILDTVDGNQYVDYTIVDGTTYIYRVQAYLGSDLSAFSNEVSSESTGIRNGVEIPKEYTLSQNYPNPFNPSTNIKFALPVTSLTKISVYDLLGREIKVLVNQRMEAGNHEILFDASALSSGVYFYRIQAGDFTQTKKMIFME